MLSALRRWAAGSNWRSFLMFAIPAAVLSGAVDSVTHDSKGSYLAHGILFGLLFGLSVAATDTRRFHGTQPQTVSGRQEVYDVVREGAGLADRSLAPAVRAYSNSIRKSLGTGPHQVETVFVILGAASVGFLIGAAHADKWLAVSIWSLFSLFYLLQLITYPKRYKIIVARLDKADQAVLQ
jgi:hypothetical protein